MLLRMRKRNGATHYVIPSSQLVVPLLRSVSVPPGAASSSLPPSTIEDFFGKGHKSTTTASPIGKWRRHIAHERASFNSASTWCEVMLNRVVTETRNLPLPNPLRTAVVCMLLQRLTPLFQPHEDLIRSLLTELFASIYVDWGDFIAAQQAKKTRSKGSLRAEDMVATRDGSDDAANEYDGELDSHTLHLTANDTSGTPADTTHSTVHVAALKRRQTFYTAYQELQQTRIEVVGRPARVLSRTVGIWRTKVLRLFFTSWRGEVAHSKKRREKNAEVVNRANKRKKQKSLRTHFSAWRTYVFERRHQCRVVYEESSRVRLVHRMGRKINNLEAEKKVLQGHCDALLEEHRHALDRLEDMRKMWAMFQRRIYETGTSATVELAQEAALSDYHAFDAKGSVVSDKATPQENSTSAPTGDVKAESIHPEQGTSASVVEDEGPPETQAVYAANVGAILGTSEPVTVTVEEASQIEKEAQSALALPHRVEQLKEYLGLGSGDTTDAGKPADPTPVPAGRAAKDSTPLTSNVIKQHAKMQKARAEETLAISKAATYRDVLDWVSLRVQLMLTQPSLMRRCTNFTTDFRDSLRLAYLFTSLGADKALLDEIFAETTILGRAQCVCNVAKCFFEEGHDYLKCPLEAIDIVKCKGSKVAKLLFAMYEKYSGIALVAPTGPLNPRLASALSILHSPSKAASMHKDTSTLSRNKSSLGGEDLKLTTSQDDMEEEGNKKEEEPIPDTQFIEWYRELAAEDSDVEDMEEYLAIKCRRKSIVDVVAERISHRVALVKEAQASELNSNVRPAGKKTVQFTPKNMGKKQSLQTAEHVVKRQQLRVNEQLIQWVAEKLTMANNGVAPQDVLSLTNLDLLERIVVALAPTARTIKPTPGNHLIRMKLLENNIAKICRMPHLKIRTLGVKGTDILSMRQILTALYVADREATLVL